MPAANKALCHMLNIRMSSNVVCRFRILCSEHNLFQFCRSEWEDFDSLPVGNCKSPDLQDSFKLFAQAQAFSAMSSLHVCSLLAKLQCVV